MRLCTAARVREWVEGSSTIYGAGWRFSQKDIVKAFGEDANGHQISAALSGMRRRGALRPVARLGGPGDKQRAIVYEVDDLKVLDGLPQRAPPAPHTVDRSNGFRSRKQVNLPRLNANGSVTMVEDPRPQLRAVDDLLMISIALEESGPTREIGLRLLKVAERIFKEA